MEKRKAMWSPGRFGVLGFLAAAACAPSGESDNDTTTEERVYKNDPPRYADSSDTDRETSQSTTSSGSDPEAPDGVGGSSDSLELPFPTDEHWQLTRGYNTGSHMDYGYDWVDDRYALDFALAGCDSWHKPATALRSGTVELVSYDEDGYGHYVLVDHGGGNKSRYAHFDEALVSGGEAVTQKTTLGYVGNSGNVTGTVCPDHPGTHLHVAYYKDGVAELPEPMSGHVNFTAGCWYGHNGWLDCDGDGVEDGTSGGTSGEGSDGGSGDGGEGSNSGEAEEDTGTSSGGSGSGEAEGEEPVEEECTWTVPGDFSTIQAAIDVATSGEVVCVESGSYTEDLTFTGQDISVRGIDGADVTHLYGVDTGAYESVVTVNSGETAAAVLEGFTLHPTFDARGLTVTWSSITLRNLVIDGADNAGAYGLFLEAATAVTVSNTAIDGCTNYGVYVPAATDITLTNLIVTGSGSAGIRVAGGGEVSVVNSVLYDNGFMGVDVRQSDATVENSIVVGHTTYALYLEDGGGNTLTTSYGTFHDNASTYSEDVRTTSGNTVEDPQFTNATGKDFTLQSSSPCRNAGDPDTAMNDADGTRSDKGAYGGPLGESW